MLWKAVFGEHYNSQTILFLVCIHESLPSHGTSTQGGVTVNYKKNLIFAAHSPHSFKYYVMQQESDIVLRSKQKIKFSIQMLLRGEGRESE